MQRIYGDKFGVTTKLREIFEYSENTSKLYHVIIKILRSDQSVLTHSSSMNEETLPCLKRNFYKFVVSLWVDVIR